MMLLPTLIQLEIYQYKQLDKNPSIEPLNLLPTCNVCSSDIIKD